MKTPDKTNTKKPLLILATAAVLIVGIAVMSITLGGNKSAEKNYAKDEASPIEGALIEAGATKNCSRGNTGRASSSAAPNYYAIFEVPGNQTQATELFIAAAKKAKFSVTPDPTAANVNNIPYSDRTSKDSSYSELKSGKIVLLVDVYKSSTHTDGDDPFCTVTERPNPPTDKTTIRFTINLPAYKQ